MIYPMTARTMEEAEERDNYFDGGMPYLNARSFVHGGYKSADWPGDDRKLFLIIKFILALALAGLVGFISAVNYV